MTVDFEWIEGGSCIICGKEFEGLHLASKKTCSNKCRQALNRYSNRVEIVYWLTVDNLAFYAKTIVIDELNAETVDKLQKLRARINTLLGN